jgi:hypothetical protein
MNFFYVEIAIQKLEKVCIKFWHETLLSGVGRIIIVDWNLAVKTVWGWLTSTFAPTCYAFFTQNAWGGCIMGWLCLSVHVFLLENHWMD